jgi:hypothetical protein
MGFIFRRQRTLALIGAVVLGLVGWSACTTARHDRAWMPYLADTAHVEQMGDEVIVSPVLDWRYDAAGPTTQSQRDAQFDVDALSDVWFVLEPQPGNALAAHTFLMFEFEGGLLEGLTIEARLEEDEEYSALRGLFRAYELAYVWGSARDLLTRRAVYLDHEVYIYPLTLTPDEKRWLLTSLLARTADLEERPRFYNTIFSNCTNELAKAVDLRWRPSFIFTGRSDNHLYRAGTISGESFEAAKARADMTTFIRELNASDEDVDFDAALLAELRARRAEMEAALTD